MISDVSYIPAVGDYFRRIGAEVRSLRTAHVREREGRYWREVAVIRFDKTGKISAPADYAPTEGEQARIIEAFASAIFPELKPCATIRSAPPAIGEADKDDVFEFRDDGGNIIMLQVRVDKDGGKSYIPYTHWTDNVWRALEPEGPLPLWGTDQLKHRSTAFLHEGAKAARAVRRMIEAQTPDMKRKLADHPWGEHPRRCTACDPSSPINGGWLPGRASRRLCPGVTRRGAIRKRASTR